MSVDSRSRFGAVRALGLLVACFLALSSVTGYAARRDLDGTRAAKNTSAPAANGYIVQLIEEPVVAYNGTIAGLKATKPQKGRKIDPNSADVTRYVAFLDSRHDTILASVGGARKQYSYRYTFNGFAADLTAEQAAKLATTPGVVSVVPNTLSQPDTTTTPSFLGLNAQGGLWSQLSGNADGNPIRANGANSSGAGEGVVVGIIDSGIWPENPSFSDRDANGKRVFQQLPGWHGKCTPGEAFPASACNQKLIAAQWFGEGFGGAAGIKASFPYEFISARGADGHGSHTASTAAGNYGVNAVVDGVSLGTISGMAPRARIAVYKTCWGIPPEGGCFNSDNVAAIDQAVADGVDVINFSISGSQTSFLDPVEVAFLFAADAGVFVAASAGNSGPAAGTVAHNSPWLTTVAASTHDRVYSASVTLGNGVSYSGISLGAGTSAAPVILSSTAVAAGKQVGEAALCFPGTLDSAKVSGKIVVCDRGVNARTEKSQVVKDAGGIGVILANTSANSLNADLHAIPTIHVDNVVGAAIKAYVTSTTTPTAQISPGQQVAGAEAPLMASFSSRGQNRASGDLLKPDITAPGVDILAAVSPIEAGRDFDFLSGTSMSSPHIAGIAALFKQKYPTWSPAAIKSALMTTAYQTNNKGNVFGNVFSYGAGHVAPNKGADPGLVYDAGFNNWFGFLCGTGQLVSASCQTLKIDPSDLNYPSIAVDGLAGAQTVKRSVTNVGSKAATYTASIQGLDGFNVVVTPSTITVAPGKTAPFTVSFTRTSAPLNTHVEGALTWSDGTHSVRSPIVLRAVALSAPAEVSGGAAGISYPITFGYTGPFSAQARGLVPAITSAGTVAQDPDQTFVRGDPTGTVAIPVTIPAGTTYARFELFDADVAAGSDIDVFVYRDTTLVGSSATGTSAEQVSLLNPVAGDYTVYVHGWGVPAGSSPFVLHTWVLGSSAAGNMTVTAPNSATIGGTGTVALSFSGLTAGVKYLGSVAYTGDAALPNPTIVRVNP